MNARFNGYYHSTVLLDQTIRSLEEGHKDNYNDVITLFPYGTLEQGKGQAGNMDEIFKKTSQVIKKHPKSKWIDDCYFLIAQSYFFKGDPYAAIETFQYIVNQYPNGGLKFASKLWILKSYLRQDKLNDAEAIMGLIRQDPDFPNSLQRDMNIIAAEIYIREGKYSQAIEKIEAALPKTKAKNERYRYHFALGQLYLKMENGEVAKQHFVKTIKLNPPYEMAFQSNLGLIKTIGYAKSGSLSTPKKYLRKMLKDDKNIDYFDQIYYELAKLEMMEQNKPGAIAYFQKSAQASTKNKDQKASSYLELANIFFEDRNFSLSQKYFDSTVMFISEEHPNYTEITARHSILTDLISNLVTIYEQDSLLAFAELPREQQDKRIEEQIRREKEAAEKAEKNASQPNSSDPFNSPTKVVSNTAAGGEWYFYNPAAVARGANEFMRKWGQRPLTDFWRLKTIYESQGQPAGNPDAGDKTGDEKPSDLAYDKQQDEQKKDFLKDVDPDKRKYYENIPISKEAKKASLYKVETALFEIGKIYQYSLKEYKLAITNYENLITRFPDSEFGAEVLFNLIKCYEALGNSDKVSSLSKELDQRYPDSKFNAVVNNKKVEEDLGEEKEVIKLYNEAYSAYKNGQYNVAIAKKNKALQDFPGNSLQAKFDYLYALCIGKTKGLDPYLKLLEDIAANYPGTDVANEAKYTLDYFKNKNNKVEKKTIDSQPERTEFTYTGSSTHYFITVFEGGELDKIKIAFSDYNKEHHRLKNFRIGDYTLGKKTIIAVQHFANKEEAESYYVEFLKNGAFYQSLGIPAYENFMISAENFKVLLRQPDTDSYSQFFVKNYIQ